MAVAKDAGEAGVGLPAALTGGKAGRAALILPLLTASGMLPGTMLAVIVTVARRGLGFSTAQAATLSAADVYGAAAGALAVALIGVPQRWRRAAAFALAAMIALDLISTSLTDFVPLMGARLARGLAGGVLMGLGYAAIGGMRSPDRTFGLLVVVQFLIGGSGIALLPGLVLAHGPWLLFAIYAGEAALMLLLLAALPPLPAPAAAMPVASARPVTPLLVAALAALMLFQASHTAGAAYVLEIARAAGLDLAFAQMAAGLGGASGALGALVIALVGTRFGRIGPIMLATAVGIVANLILLTGTPLTFALGAALSAASWGAAIPLVLGTCATLDLKGRGAAWASFAAKIGLASGPVLGALTIRGSSYAPAVLLACLLSAVAAFLLRHVDRARRG